MRSCMMGLGLLLAAATPALAIEPLEFFTVYVDQLGAQEKARAATLATTAGTPSEKFQACVKNTHDFAVLLHSHAVALSQMKFDNFLSEMVPGLADLADKRADMEGQLGGVCMALAETGHSPEEIAELSAMGPQISEKIVQAESIVFDAMPIIVRSLYVDGAEPQIPGAKLTITRAQRAALIAKVDDEMPALKGKSADDIIKGDEGSYAVASAGLLKALLLKAKGSDEA